MTPGNGRRRAVESWWPILRDISMFLTGLLLLMWQTVFEIEAQGVLVGAGLALMGAGAVGQLQQKVRGRAEEDE